MPSRFPPAPPHPTSCQVCTSYTPRQGEHAVHVRLKKQHASCLSSQPDELRRAVVNVTLPGSASPDAGCWPCSTWACVHVVRVHVVRVHVCIY